MDPVSILILLLVLVGVFFAVRAIARHKTGGCSGCTGDCTHCSKMKSE